MYFILLKSMKYAAYYKMKVQCSRLELLVSTFNSFRIKLFQSICYLNLPLEEEREIRLL